MTTTAPRFALTGIPRGGTTYLAAVVHDPPGVVVLSEAQGRWKTLYEADGDAADPLPIFDAFRERIAQGEAVATFDGTPGYDGDGRVDTWNQPKHERVLEVAGDFAFGMKNPEVFLAWLPTLLDAGLPVVVSVRHPLGTIASWTKRPGGFANGECATFRAESDDPIDRRVELYDHFARQIDAVRAHPRVLVIQHEAWYTDADQLARVCAHLGVTTPRTLQPPPIAPEPVALDEAEQTRIIETCAGAALLGYAKAGEHV